MDLVASGVRRESQQAKADPGHPAAEPGQADRLPVQVPQRPSGRRAVQRREGLSHQADQRVETFAGIGACWAKVVRCLYCFGFTVSLFSPVPRTYPSSPLEGTTRNYLYAGSHYLLCLDPFFSYLLTYAQGEKKKRCGL